MTQIHMWTKGTIAVALFGAAVAFPPQQLHSVEKRWDGFSPNLTERLGQYMPPLTTDSRGPCPGLNTLANHGLINRNGKDIVSDDIVTAFAQGFGIAFDAIATALHNFEVVCEYVSGVTCGVPEEQPARSSSPT